MRRSWSSRWKRIKGDLTFQDLALDVIGKVLLALGFGALFAHTLAPYIGTLIVVGFALSAVVKAKYWKRFWNG